MHSRVVVLVFVLVASACTAAGGETTTTASQSVDTTTAPTTTTSTTTPPTSPPTTAPTTTTTTEPPPEPDPTYFVFMPDGLAEGFPDLVGAIDGLTGLALVQTETLHITETREADATVVDSPRRGFVIPVQGIAVTADDFWPLVDLEVATALANLGSDEVLLSESSAELRRLGPGGAIDLEAAGTVTVAAVVPDTAFGGQEIITTNPDLVGGEGAELRSAIVQFAGGPHELEEALQMVLPEDAAFGVHPRGMPESQSTAVRNQVWIKQTFGEFAYQPTGGGRFRIDPDWLSENIVTRSLPLLGTTTCHRRFADVLTDVMKELIARGEGDAIDRGAFFGCWNSRYVANSQRLSRHAWGAAADINFFNSLDGGAGSPVNPVLLEVMASFGVRSGHAWSIPDPGHFEFYGFPEDE